MLDAFVCLVIAVVIFAMSFAFLPEALRLYQIRKVMKNESLLDDAKGRNV